MKSTLISPAGIGTQLVTNVNHFRNQLEPRGRRMEKTDDPTVVGIREYLAHLLKGAAGRADCPFVGAIERNNGYHVLKDDRAPGEIDFDDVVPRMVGHLHVLSPARTYADQQFDPTILMRAFTHPDAMSEEFCSRLDAARDATRLAVMREGRMISQMHPRHPGVPGKAAGFTSPVPMLTMKRMHRQDGRLLSGNPESKAIYDSFFDPPRGLFHAD